MKKTFEDFLRDWHGKDYIGTDDDMPDAYDAWSSELDIEMMERLGNIYGKEMFLRGMDHAIQVLKEVKI